jgi:hypothetical protein
MALAPYSSRRNAKYARNTDSQQEVACQDRNFCESDHEDQRQCQSVRCEDRAEGCRENRNNGKDDENNITFPKGPVLPTN